MGTSKINYIDPRISSAWCKRYDVPIDKIFNRTLRDKFKWAMDMNADWLFDKRTSSGTSTTQQAADGDPDDEDENDDWRTKKGGNKIKFLTLF